MNYSSNIFLVASILSMTVVAVHSMASIASLMGCATNGGIASGSPAILSEAPSSTRLSMDELRVVLSGEKALTTPNSAEPSVVSLAFRARVLDHLLYSERLLLAAHVRERGNFVDHSAFDQFGPSTGERVYIEYVPPTEVLDRVIGEACREAAGGVRTVMGRGISSPALTEACSRAEEDIRASIAQARDDLVSDLHCLSALHRYFVAEPHEDIGQALLKAKNNAENIKRQLSWYKSWDPASGGHFVDGGLQKAYEATQSLWDGIIFYVNIGVPVSWQQVHGMAEYSAAREAISAYAPDHVDELLTFMLEFRVAPSLLKNDLDEYQEFAQRELQSLEMARNLGGTLKQPLPYSHREFIAQLMLDLGLTTV